MQVQILAAMAAAALAGEPAALQSQAPSQTQSPADNKTVSPVTVTPLAKPPPADLQLQASGSEDTVEPADVFWPSTAFSAGLGGKARLRCLVDVHGLAERCEVASEDPAGKGFGRAALELRATFKMPPPQGPNGPVAGFKTIEVDFKPPDRNFDMAALLGGGTFNQGNPLAMTKVSMLDNPVWVRAASFEDLAKADPVAGGDEEGYAVDHCRVARDGALRDCVAIVEIPEKHGFGKAAVGLANRFRVDPQQAQAHVSGTMMVNLPIRFPSAAELAQRTVMAPYWIAGVDPTKAPRLFPPEAAANGLTTGRGVARCTVSGDGGLTACAPEAGDPDGLGFSEAAVKLAATMRMNLWGADGAPVEGGVIHVPIRLNLKGAGG